MTFVTEVVCFSQVSTARDDAW